MTEDLYQDPATSFLPAPENIITEVSNSQGVLGISLPVIISYINVFAFAWCVLYSIIYFADFYFYLVKYADKEVPRMQKGAKSFKNAVLLWAGYLVCLIFFGLYVGFQDSVVSGLFGFLAIAVYLVKIFYFDLTRVYKIGDNVKKVYASVGETFSNLLKNIGGSGDKKE